MNGMEGIRKLKQKIGQLPFEEVEGEKSDDRVSAVWSQAPEQRIASWMEHPLVRSERLNRMVSGSPDHDCHQWFLGLARDLGVEFPVARALSLGCGFGELERGYSQYCFALIHEGVDLSDVAVAEARRRAQEAGLDHVCYRTADLNFVDLPEGRHDVVLAHQSLHHIERLEHLAEQVRRTLKPGGLFMMSEYVGLNCLQVSPVQKEFTNSLFSLLPERYLRTDDGALRQSVEVTSAQDVMTYDPSEAVRSEDIIDVMGQYFQLVGRRDFGGNVLFHGLNGIISNFEPGDSLDDRWLHWLFEAEDCLLAEGVPSDFAVLVYRRPE